jgi:CDP-glycerol glycerophosphotransferase (TagB/SpsB family)
MMSDAQEFCDAYYNDRSHRFNPLRDFVPMLFFPRWIRKYKGRTIKRLPSSGMIVAKEIMGVAPPLPWQIHSGFTDGILVESIRMRQFAVSRGLPENKIYLTGVASHDVMAKNLIESEKKRRDIYQKFGIKDDLPFILLAMPQDDHPQGYARPFPAYKDMVLFLAESLSACNGYHIIVCPHPSISRDRINFIEKLGLKISDEPTFSVIPACDIFIATFSSTIRWAISCSKPVISYDYYRCRWNEFSEASGVLIVEDKDAFRGTLKKLTTDKQFYAKIQEKQRQSSAQWGQLDGHASDRILNALDSFVNSAV